MLKNLLVTALRNFRKNSVSFLINVFGLTVGLTSCSWIGGRDAHTALSGPRKVILSESTVRKYFNREDPMGKILRVGTDSTPYMVTGVMTLRC